MDKNTIHWQIKNTPIANRRERESKKYYILLFLVCLNSYAMITAQNISVDKNCLEKRTAILASSLIDLFGEDIVSKMLNDKVNFVFTINVDSFGCILDIKVRDIKQYLSKTQIQQIETHLINNNIYFDICYNIDPWRVTETEEYIMEQIRKDFQLPCLISVGFPYPLMLHFPYENSYNEKPNRKISKFEYLKIQIEKYLSH